MAYCTIQDVRDEGFLIGTYPDDRVTFAITLASAFIDRATGRFFEPRDLTLELSGRGKAILRLPHPPISFTSVKLVADDGDETEVTSDEYRLLMNLPDERHRPRLKFIGGSWPEGDHNVEIVGSFGFVDDLGDTNTVPVLIKRACVIIAAAALPTVSEIGTTGGEVISETIDDYTYRLSEGVEQTVLSSPEVKMAIQAYRKVSGGAT